MSAAAISGCAPRTKHVAAPRASPADKHSAAAPTASPCASFVVACDDRTRTAAAPEEDETPPPAVGGEEEDPPGASADALIRARAPGLSLIHI